WNVVDGAHVVMSGWTRTSEPLKRSTSKVYLIKWPVNVGFHGYHRCLGAETCFFVAHQKTTQKLNLGFCDYKPPGGEVMYCNPEFSFLSSSVKCSAEIDANIRKLFLKTCCFIYASAPSGSDVSSSSMTRSWFCRRPVHHRLPGAQRSNYDLRERICIGSMTALETAVYQQVPTDEAEAQMLASADLDDMKSHRFEDNPGVRRHLVKKSSRCQMSRTSISSMPLSSLKKKKRLFVELNELIVEKDHEMRWKERARWIKFEEDVEEETDRWGKPHVASLSFRSLLELRRTITHGAILLDLEQNSLPGIAHLMVETMIISDQIRAEDRPNVLRALLLKHRHRRARKHMIGKRLGLSQIVDEFIQSHNPLCSHVFHCVCVLYGLPSAAFQLQQPPLLWRVYPIKLL
uniref:Band 3 cytoplasmic domain-containing protein n=1 Tax=Nothobranchius furzeri TaxID=105023 RepID=A0A8C6KWN7_NOTFU